MGGAQTKPATSPKGPPPDVQPLKEVKSPESPAKVDVAPQIQRQENKTEPIQQPKPEVNVNIVQPMPEPPVETSPKSKPDVASSPNKSFKAAPIVIDPLPAKPVDVTETEVMELKPEDFAESEQEIVEPIEKPSITGAFSMDLELQSGKSTRAGPSPGANAKNAWSMVIEEKSDDES